MGRALLILAACALLTACQPPETPVRGEDPHATITCQGCHNGPTGERGRAAVPVASCTAAGCHADAGPETVRLATAEFHHRGHGDKGDIATSCAGCHTHDRGGEPLRAAVDACALCHVGQLTGQEPAECRTCHQAPNHSGLTNQGLPVAHSSLPWIETGCVRCHYDVAEPRTQVASSRCLACHTDVERLTAAAIGEDLHPRHRGLTCTSCHEAGAHRVVAMSAAVSLVCSDCHTQAHAQVIATLPGPETCASCHQAVHSAQQRLVLGLEVETRAAPSLKFLAGMTCRSCHVPPAASGRVVPSAIRGQAESCVGCHPAGYDRVLGWWIDGIDRRQQAVARYLSAARRDLGNAPDTARALVERADALNRLVAEAGGQHNLELSDRIFREGVAQAAEAYRLAGRRAPAPPDLGPRPHAGLCSYCHYSPADPWDFRRMPEDFHRELYPAATTRP
jgi:hypothetical protein